ncbi:MAG: hypothetical protein J6U89_07360 [Bacteroidaceae bacterium]|nr:hypothetical protein [Bacteroidaceae bacterium]
MTVTFPTSIWAQERNIMTLGSFNSSTAYVLIVCNTAPMSGVTAKYTIPASGDLQIDMSDLVRVVSNGSVTVSERTASGSLIGTSTTKTWTRAGLINPAHVIAPANEIGSNFGAIVFAPSMMLKSATPAQIMFELYCADGYLFSTGRVKELPSDSVQNFARSVAIDTDTAAVEFWHLSDESYGSIAIRDLEPCKNYATVEWVSFSGATRRHTFEVINCTTETIDAVSLQNLQNFYDERKGRRDGFVLRLEDLNRYDFWYYSDLITSSYVRVMLNGKSWRQVQVVTKAAKIPDNDEGKLNTLEIEVNYAKYATL